MTEPPHKYTSLRDYIALIRRQRVLIVLCAVVFGAVSLLYSTAQDPSYRATASVSFRDVAQDLPLLGGSALPVETPAERAARNAELVTSEQLASQVQRKLDSELSTSSLLNAIRARVELQTNLVTVEARSEDARLAADLANAFARAAVDRASREEQARLDRAIDGLRVQVGADGTDSLETQFVKQRLSQLLAVKELLRPARVTSLAAVPDSPVSPKPVRNSVLGLLAGLVFGVIAAFARDALDRRLRDPHAVHRELDAPILGRIGSTALGSSGLLSGAGAFITPRDLESFQMLRSNLAFFNSESQLRSVLITSGAPEEGKSTVAAGLASAAAAAGQRTLLVECDLRRPVLAGRLGLRASPGLADYLSGNASPREILQMRDLSGGVTAAPERDETELEPPERGHTLVCITAGDVPGGPAELLASNRCRAFFEKVQNAYDFVVIDTSPMLATADPSALAPLVDVVLVCVRMSRSTADELRGVRDALALLPSRPTGIVLTGLRGGRDGYGYYGAEYGA